MASTKSATTPAELLAGSEVLRRRERVAVIGAGTIGASWTALFLAHGLEVRVHDPAPDVADRVQAAVAQIAPVLAAQGLPADGLTQRLHFSDDLEAALDGVGAVQENGPENMGFKRDLWARVERAVGADVCSSLRRRACGHRPWPSR